jgi:hypothetical protein
MLTLTRTSNKAHVKINYSSLELLQTCLRKSHYALNLGLRQDTESDALAFGSSIHKALEHWYQLPQEERELPDKLKEEAELMAFGHGTSEPARHGALEAIRQFVLCKHATLSQLPEDDKRSLAAGIRILRAYFKRYADDGLTVLLDNTGKPYIERLSEYRLIDTDDLTVDYFGTIDVILQNKETGIIMVTDHKTTATLGTEFYNRCKPNPQYTGYVLLANKALNLNTNLFMINGIQTAKTKTEFARQVTERNEEDFAELTMSIDEQVRRWLRAIDKQAFPQTAPNPCSAYGGCQYRTICEVPNALKSNVIKANYGDNK